MKIRMNVTLTDETPAEGDEDFMTCYFVFQDIHPDNIADHLLDLMKDGDKCEITKRFGLEPGEPL